MRLVIDKLFSGSSNIPRALFCAGKLVEIVVLRLGKLIAKLNCIRDGYPVSLIHKSIQISNVSVKSKLKHPPPVIPRAFDVFCCPGGREFDELSLPRGGAFDHYSYGVGNLIACFDFMLRRADSTWLDKSWWRQALMHTKRKIPDSWRTG